MTVDARVERITPEGAGADVALLIAPPRAGGVDRTCTDLLTTATPERSNVLFVTTRPADRVLARFRGHGNADPNEVAVVAVGRASRPTSLVDDPTVRRVETVENASNLTKVGVAVTDVLAAWSDDDVEIAVCVDSVTALLQYADGSVVFRFLAELIDRFRRVDAAVHVHVDPKAHDEATINTLLQLFDVVIEAPVEASVDDRSEPSEPDVVDRATGDGSR